MEVTTVGAVQVRYVIDFYFDEAKAGTCAPGSLPACTRVLYTLRVTSHLPHAPLSPLFSSSSAANAESHDDAQSHVYHAHTPPTAV
jgi:hypothetical protein